LGKELFLFTLFSLVILFIPQADAATVIVSAPAGSGVPGCEKTNQCFIPPTVTINIGDTVVWSNDDTAAHTVTSGTAADGPDGAFDSSLFMSGTSYSVEFNFEGEYQYFCMVHPWMVGVVSVGPPIVPPIPGPTQTPSTFGQIQSPIVVITDKASYSDGEIILVTGEVRDLISGVPVTLTLKNPRGNLITIAQPTVGADMKFSTEITIGGLLWKSPGTYTIEVLYGSNTRTAETTFYFGGTTTPTPTPPLIPTPPQIPTPTPTPTPTDASFPVEYVVIAVAIAVAVGIGIALSRRKKVAPVISVSPAKAQTAQRQDDTQFWVCPHCGGDTQYRNGKQFCPSCNMYL